MASRRVASLEMTNRIANRPLNERETEVFEFAYRRGWMDFASWWSKHLRGEA
jgi:hypothetical protein